MNARIVSFLPILVSQVLFAAVPSSDELKSGMKKAAAYFHGEVAVHGGYVYYYSPDLSRRLGEGPADDNEVWVQSPGTPRVGRAYLAAYEATGDPFYLKAAKDAANALLHGQLETGGWTNSIHFTPGHRNAARYRNGRGNVKGRDFSTLDDGITQDALLFLMRLDKALAFEDETVHEVAFFALESLLSAQFENGAFPQGWDGTPAARSTEPVDKHAAFPDYDWKTEGRIKEFWDCYNLNDGIAPTVAETLVAAHQIYGREDCRDALAKLGDFLICAQMPEPQQAWAQQYNRQMNPIWARKFEPPAIASRESEGVIAALLTIASHCREKKYLEPVPSALDYLERSALPDGRLARYYELRSNRPLYMEREGKEYRLTNDDARLPSHYGWKNESRVPALREVFDNLLAGKPLPGKILFEGSETASPETLLAALDDEGRWLSRFDGELLLGQPKFKKGETYLSSAVFSANLETLAAALGSGKDSRVPAAK